MGMLQGSPVVPHGELVKLTRFAGDQVSQHILSIVCWTPKISDSCFPTKTPRTTFLKHLRLDLSFEMAANFGDVAILSGSVGLVGRKSGV